MRDYLMDLNRLYYFTRVASHLSFSKAAEECHIAQTAMSRYIASLEKELGFTLLVRGPHKVELTAAGQYYLESCIQILNTARQAQTVCSQISEGAEETLSIGFGGYEVSLAKHYAREFSRRYPKCSLLMQEYSYDRLLSALLMEKCDVIFSPDIRVERVSSVRHKVISRAKYSILCSRHDSFFGKATLLPADLDGKVFISSTMDNRDGIQMQTFWNNCSTMGFHAGKLILTNSVVAAVSMIELGTGVCLVSEEYAENLGPDVCNILIDTDAPLRKVHTAAYREDDIRCATHRFMDLIDGIP